jgi:hypothetical protein
MDAVFMLDHDILTLKNINYYILVWILYMHGVFLFGFVMGTVMG